MKVELVFSDGKTIVLPEMSYKLFLNSNYYVGGASDVAYDEHISKMGQEEIFDFSDDSLRDSKIRISSEYNDRVFEFSLGKITERTPPSEYKKSLVDVYGEVEYAKSKFPEDFVGYHEGYAVLLEEVDELWDEVKKKESARDENNLYSEAKQVAAVAVRIMTELGKRPENKKESFSFPERVQYQGDWFIGEPKNPTFKKTSVGYLYQNGDLEHCLPYDVVKILLGENKMISV